jgi:hypothetical protein
MVGAMECTRLDYELVGEAIKQRNSRAKQQQQSSGISSITSTQ